MGGAVGLGGAGEYFGHLPWRTSWSTREIGDNGLEFVVSIGGSSNRWISPWRKLVEVGGCGVSGLG